MQQVAQYKKNNINTSDNVRLISLLYEGAVNYIRISKKKMEEGDIAGKGLYIGKATAIVGELSSVLNMDAGEIPQNLRRLYDFILDRLLQANLKNDLKAFDDAEKILSVLKDAWKEMERGLSKSTNVIPKIENNAGIELRV